MYKYSQLPRVLCGTAFVRWLLVFVSYGSIGGGAVDSGMRSTVFVDAVSCNSVKIPGNCKRNPNFDG